MLAKVLLEWEMAFDNDGECARACVVYRAVLEMKLAPLCRARVEFENIHMQLLMTDKGCQIYEKHFVTFSMDEKTMKEEGGGDVQIYVRYSYAAAVDRHLQYVSLVYLIYLSRECLH